MTKQIIIIHTEKQQKIGATDITVIYNAAALTLII